MKNYLIKIPNQRVDNVHKKFKRKKGLPEKIQTALFILMNKTKRLQE